ncbi:MAG: hypothetical protein M1315_01085 [Candidatus Thermoplasmatota archaeon]|nr:hypothetical protein [Candidatus Thermoplasmatota archaeon]
MILNNLFVATLRKKGIVKYVATGVGTGYSFTVSKHNRSMKEKQEETVKRKQFVYSFALMELNARMYIGHEV